MVVLIIHQQPPGVRSLMKDIPDPTEQFFLFNVSGLFGSFGKTIIFADTMKGILSHIHRHHHHHQNGMKP